MSADPPPSLLITPDRRRRLQQQFDEARQLAAQPRGDFRRIHELLAECVRADPGNILYVDALLANLKRRDAEAARANWWARLWSGGWPRRRGHRTAADVNSVLSTQYSVLTDAPQTLWNRTSTPTVFHQLAAAAAEHDFEEVEHRYLAAARELAPDDVTTLRLLARALTRQGRFEDAIGPWFAVLALAPGDLEAEQAVDDLRSVTSADVPAMTGAGLSAIPALDAAALLEQAADSRAAGQLSLAEDYFAQAQSALGGDLTLLKVREDLRLQKSQQRVDIARVRAAHDQHHKAEGLVARLAQEHNRLEIDIENLRAERLPTDWPIRLTLARSLKAAGNFSGAVERLEEARRLAPREPAIFLELGECWQHLRQFDKALTLYEQAIELTNSDESQLNESATLARYRAGVLAAALGKVDEARAHFELLARLEPLYKDVVQRLAALPASRQDESKPLNS